MLAWGAGLPGNPGRGRVSHGPLPPPAKGAGARPTPPEAGRRSTTGVQSPSSGHEAGAGKPESWAGRVRPSFPTPCNPKRRAQNKKAAPDRSGAAFSDGGVLTRTRTTNPVALASQQAPTGAGSGFGTLRPKPESDPRRSNGSWRGCLPRPCTRRTMRSCGRGKPPAWLQGRSPYRKGDPQSPVSFPRRSRPEILHTPCQRYAVETIHTGFRKWLLHYPVR